LKDGFPSIIGITKQAKPITNIGLEKSKKNKLPAKDPLFGELLMT